MQHEHAELKQKMNNLDAKIQATKMINFFKAMPWLLLGTLSVICDSAVYAILAGAMMIAGEIEGLSK